MTYNINDKVQLKSLQEYEDAGDEITDLIEQFAGQTVTIVSIEPELNSFNERVYFGRTKEGNFISFSEHEVSDN